MKDLDHVTWQGRIVATSSCLGDILDGMMEEIYIFLFITIHLDLLANH